MADDRRSPQQRIAHAALARLDEITITPELVIGGRNVAAERGYPPYTLRKRTFTNAAHRDAASAGYDALCATGCSPEKAWRIYFSTEGPDADDIRGLIERKLALPE